MRRPFLVSRYLQSKADTEAISTWLARACIEHGYPLDEFELSADQTIPEQDAPEHRTKQQQKNAKKNAKKKAKKQQQHSTQAAHIVQDDSDDDGSDDNRAQDSVAANMHNISLNDAPQSAPSAPKTLPRSKYNIKTSQYLKLARFIAKTKIEVPLELLQLIQRCCALRLATLKRFLPKPDLSTKTHQYFVDILRQVGSILHQAREQALSERAASAAANGNTTKKPPFVPSVNRFASLADLEDETKATSDELPDIYLADPPKPKAAKCSAVNVHFGHKDSAEEAIEDLISFFSDLHDVRDYLKDLWQDYKQGRTDLMTAAVTTNTALELLRRPHDELMTRIMPLFNNSLTLLYQLLFNFVRMHLTGVPDIYFLHRYDMVDPFDLTSQMLYDYFFVPCWQVVDAMSRVIGPNGTVPVLKLGHYGVYDTKLDHETLPFRQKWSQAQIVILEGLSDYLLILTALRPKERDSTHFFYGDETARLMSDLSNTKQCTLLTTFAAQVFLDINFLLKSDVQKGWAQLHRSAQSMKKSMEMRPKVEPGRPENWAPTNEILAASLVDELDGYCQADDPMTLLRRSISASIPGAPRNTTSNLMLHNPVLCGILLFRLHLLHQDFGLTLANTWGTILYTAHLRHACQQLGTAGNDTPAWPDMDLILQLHDAEHMFGGKLPESVVDAQISLLRMQGYSTDVLRAMRAVGNGAQAPFRPGHKLDMASAQGPRGLEDRTQILPIFKEKYLAVFGERTRIDIHTVEKLISDLAQREDEAARKRDRQQRRMHKAPKFTILQMLSVLERGLKLETDSIRLDYVSLHLRCITMLQKVRAASDTYLRGKLGPNYLDNECQLPMVVCWIFHVAVMSQRAAEQMGIQRQIRQDLGSRTLRDLEFKSQLLVGAEKVLNDYLRSTGEGDAELKKMRLA
ncbi:hypothetical protein OC846_006067 [Tilletia horrida]|uniref:DUF6604 domain-containing protein n=1 Tax=Tilletia horrida TaxID=155126 RepID=A0AAN6GMC6_9BASI|nr:hypothetical protein OC846_006067 [Tilletia horrida]KAK0559600.1 hypothetical protein OC861_006591 [Tilletia horrida]